MQRWEYKTLRVESHGFFGGKVDIQQFEDTLNAHGHEGWELVSAFDTNYNNGGTRFVVVILKRPRA